MPRPACAAQPTTSAAKAGSSTAGNAAQQAFLYSNGAMTSLGTLGGSGTSSKATGINNTGQVVGFSNTAGEGEGNANYQAFLYSNGTMTNLGTLGGTFSVGSAINQVVAVQGEAKQAAMDLLAGGKGDIHNVALAAQRAELSMELFQQVRNKFVQAYQEIMKMPM